MSQWLLPLVSLLYIALLFVVAYWGESHSPRLSPRQQGLFYSLTLAVYCTSWTFYGAVGATVTGGWAYLPIYLGPLLFIWFGRQLLERLVLTSKAQSITSIADFIAARYGKAQHLAAMVAVVAIIGALPYIALQLKAVAMSVSVLHDAGLGSPFPTSDTAFWISLLLAALAMLFGTRKINATEHHQGLMMAVALESVVKLFALVVLGLYAWHELEQLPAGWSHDTRLDLLLRPEHLPTGFLAQVLLAFLAMMCLPRQFHVAVVECSDVSQVRKASFWFGGYLLLIIASVLPIAMVAMIDSRLASTHPDIAVLALPLAMGNEPLAVLAFIGGFSAAAGMVIVATVALSTMICNDLIVPLLLRYRRFGNLALRLLLIRRLAIAGLALLGYGYYRLIEEFDQLASVGLLAFSAVAQFAPALIGGLFWRGGSRQGVAAGLAAGFAVWVYTLMLPALIPAMGYDSSWLTSGPLGQAWLQPQALFHLTGWDPLTHGVFWSLLVNISLFVLISLRFRPAISDQLDAGQFLEPWSTQSPELNSEEWQRLPLSELHALVARILGEEATRQAFEQFARGRMQMLDLRRPASRSWVQFCERLLAAAMGTASARALLTTALRGSGLEIGQVLALLDQSSQLQRFNRGVLNTMMEHIEQGISVVDADMKMVAWNRRYLEMFDYPEGMVYPGCPVADLIRYNAERGECGPGDIEEHVSKRIAHMRQGNPHVFERIRADGQVLEMRGQPVPGGGFVTTFADISHFKRAERTLAEAKEALEERVALRTAELETALHAQEQAKQQAEQANQSKTRFLAAASHDLLQPMNAARLFSSALSQHPELVPDAATLAHQLDSSLRGAEELLSALLDISRLDAGALNPNHEAICLSDLVRELVEQVRPVAAKRQLALRVRLPKDGAWVCSDRQWLRRILQNLLSNALRYTREGGVLIGIRRSGDGWRVDVRDTGPGIPVGKQAQIFEEFQRGGEASPWGEKGMGLGLAIVDRMVRLLGHHIRVRSMPGHGACFTLMMTAATPVPRPAPGSDQPSPGSGNLQGLVVLCVDNEPDILAGMRALLGRWGCQVVTAGDGDEARRQLAAHDPAVVLADYHLADGEDGLALLRALAAGRAGALVTADNSDEVAAEVKAAGLGLLRKPVKPAALRAFLAANARH
ncbi:PAS domain-containing hybrid sensor histidine kinase/response regulator [Amnimonas aquatica]|uniref:histidine kinase n=1 Tax=Amnimonas aquatica TaxID=2094561 RepID=A0A2P6ATF1_9GAMM|nr:PAS-domain containing protein [Amnimonas aquatica]PQA46750.1 hybrid sensor histidine kinase/response regulator [Amnimonas aquatica]